MTNYQCYCYGIIAIQNLLDQKVRICSDSFYNELYYLWDMYTEESIENKYNDMEINGNIL